MGEFSTEKLHILDVEINRFSIAESSSETDQIHFKLEKCDIGVNLPKKVVKIVFDISLGGQSACSFKIEVLFKVDNLDELVEQDEETKVVRPLEKHLYPHLSAIAYSTIRGIVYTKTLGVKEGGILLPIIHPRRFYKRFLEEEKESDDS